MGCVPQKMLSMKTSVTVITVRDVFSEINVQSGIFKVA